jgi:tRNA A37 threonylcarbamoyladenosine synthetase subunit TsaC/SUA5/YrdC
MRVVSLDNVFDLDKLASEMLAVVESNGIVVCPSVSGYIALISEVNLEAISLLRQLTNKKDTIPFLVSSMAQISKLTNLDEVGLELIEEYLPGELIVEFDGVGSYESLGVQVRFMDHTLLNLISSKYDKQLLSFELMNKSGGLIYSLEELWDCFPELTPDFILDAGIVLNLNKPPAIVKVVDNQIDILRDGKIIPRLLMQFSVRKVDLD